eukprot:m.230123 g.230123  ORF g.230123 m.230123 type:complete len:455 (-) comp33572_c0_seq6:11-1375(-)
MAVRTLSDSLPQVFAVIACACIAIFILILSDSSITKTYTVNRVTSVKREANFRVDSIVSLETDAHTTPEKTQTLPAPTGSVKPTTANHPPAAECKSYTWKGMLWKEFVPEHHYQVSKSVAQNNHVSVSPAYNALLAKNHRPFYKAVAKDVHNIQTFDPSYLTMHLATFNDAMVTKGGRIYAASVGDEVHTTECVATANGGCWFDTRRDHIGGVTDVQSDFKDVVDYKDRTIVTLAVNVNGATVWHFVMENLAAMAVLEGRNEHDFLLHLGERNAFVDTWLKLVLPMISEDRIISGNVKTKRLLVPSLNCGNPRPMQLEWLRMRLFLNPIFNSTTPSDLPLLVTRTHSRQVNGWSGFSALPHRDHDDSRLGSVNEQLVAFHISPAVIAPHGAGLVNLVAAKPGTCVVEVMPPGDIFNICYMKLSYLLGLKYFGILKSGITPSDVTEIKTFIENCE